MIRFKGNSRPFRKRSGTKQTEPDPFKGAPMAHKYGQCRTCLGNYPLSKFAHRCPKIALRKFQNHYVILDHLTFDSLREAQKYSQRVWLLAQNIISDLIVHPRFELRVDGQKVCSYVGDFRYTHKDKKIVEDIKGVETPVFKLKAKLFRILYPDLQLVITR